MSDSTPLANKKILVVEDHPLFRAMLVQLIEQELCMTVCGEVDNINDAMEIIGQAVPDVVIVDLTLQGSSGLELIKDLQGVWLERSWERRGFEDEIDGELLAMLVIDDQ